ncbi:MAG: MerR family transcriptional regulator [Alphaproteobacteria bacterium]|nr:MerR family transcriptional regulator [Alphaproteobacteria bacterium]
MNKSKSAFKTIAEVADELGVATHVLRFWETKFNQIKPMKTSGGRRYYRPDDVEIIRLIKNLLYGNRYTIEGAQQLIKSRGLKALLGDEEIQRDFFEQSLSDDSLVDASAQSQVVANDAVQPKMSEAFLRGIADAVCELKTLRAKLTDL